MFEERHRKLWEEIERAFVLSGRNDRNVKIVVVSKGRTIDEILNIYRLGYRDFGENRVQEAESKVSSLNGYDITWHMVGHLQTNKVKKALKLFHVIQSVDSLKLMDSIERRVEGMVNVMLEFNISGEPQKYGFKPEEMERAVEYILQKNKLKLTGFMGIGPYPVDELKTRRAFSLLRNLKEKAETQFSIRIPYLSMGMSEDFFYAILEGANMLRIGRFLFEDI